MKNNQIRRSKQDFIDEAFIALVQAHITSGMFKTHKETIEASFVYAKTMADIREKNLIEDSSVKESPKE